MLPCAHHSTSKEQQHHLKSHRWSFQMYHECNICHSCISLVFSLSRQTLWTFLDSQLKQYVNNRSQKLTRTYIPNYPKLKVNHLYFLEILCMVQRIKQKIQARIYCIVVPFLFWFPFHNFHFSVKKQTTSSVGNKRPMKPLLTTIYGLFYN